MGLCNDEVEITWGFRGIIRGNKRILGLGSQIPSWTRWGNHRLAWLKVLLCFLLG